MYGLRILPKIGNLYFCLWYIADISLFAGSPHQPAEYQYLKQISETLFNNKVDRWVVSVCDSDTEHGAALH